MTYKYYTYNTTTNLADFEVERIADKGQHAYCLGQPHQHVQLHHTGVLGCLQVQIQCLPISNRSSKLTRRS